MLPNSFAELQSLILSLLPIAVYRVTNGQSFAGPRHLTESLASRAGFVSAQFIADEALWSSRIPEEDLTRLRSDFTTLSVGSPLLTDYRWRCADDGEIHFLDLAVMYEDDDGERAIVGFCLDITSAAQRRPFSMASSGAVAAGSPAELRDIAHEFNNMISVIIWNLEPLTKALENTGKPLNRVQFALQAASRCSDLIQRLASKEQK